VVIARPQLFSILELVSLKCVFLYSVPYIRI